jgi:hypothetical protein
LENAASVLADAPIRADPMPTLEESLTLFGLLDDDDWLRNCDGYRV